MLNKLNCHHCYIVIAINQSHGDKDSLLRSILNFILSVNKLNVHGSIIAIKLCTYVHNMHTLCINKCID